MTELDYNVEQIVKGELLAPQVIYLLRRGAMAVQAERGLTVDGAAGPKTRAEIDALLTLEKLPSVIMPKGKGMFMRTLKLAGTIPEVLDGMKVRGLSWVAITRIWQYPVADKPTSLFNTTQLPEYAAALRDAGHEVWVWGYPAPGKHEEFVEKLVGTAVAVKARGIILDPEEPFIGRPEEAVALMAAALAAAAQFGLGVGVTSYGAPWNFPTFPWSAFLGAGFGMPQIYDASNSMPMTYPVKSVNAWKKLGFTHVAPISAAFNKSLEQMTALLKATPIEGTVSWWDWYNCNGDPKRWDAVQGYTLGG